MAMGYLKPVTHVDRRVSDNCLFLCYCFKGISCYAFTDTNMFIASIVRNVTKSFTAKKLDLAFG